jgi:hypothetical protein
LSKSDVTGEVTYKKVVNTFIRKTNEISKVTFTNSSILETTWNHPFRKMISTLPGDTFSIENSEWVEARDLSKGDKVYSADGSLSVVESVVIDQREETVYNFEVEDFHTYFVGESGFWVHNQDCSGGLSGFGRVLALETAANVDCQGSHSCLDSYRENNREIIQIQNTADAVGGVGAAGVLASPTIVAGGSAFLAGIKAEAIGIVAPALVGLGSRLNLPSVVNLGSRLITRLPTNTTGQGTTALSAGSTGGQAKVVFDERTGQYRNLETGRFVSPTQLPWPNYPGFDGKPVLTTLRPGTVVDRFGNPNGEFASIPGTSVSARGLPPGSEARPYHQYIVYRPITVPAGPTLGVPDFGATGGGTQYLFQGGINRYSDYLKELK